MTEIINFNCILHLLDKSSYLQKDGDKYLKNIKKHPELRKCHRVLTKKLKEFTKEELLRFKSSGYEQTGGSMSGIIITSLAIGSMSLVSAYLLYLWMRPKKCKPSYEISINKKMMSLSEFIGCIIPISFIEKIDKLSHETNKTITDDIEFIKMIQDELKEVNKIFDYISEDKIDKFGKHTPSITKKIKVRLFKITSSISAAIATMGSGGDEIISFLFTMRDAVDLISNVLDSILTIIKDEYSSKYLYDLLSIDFHEGSFGVKCRVKYISEQYKNVENMNLNSTYNVICTFFNVIEAKLEKFAANAIGTMIPDSIGLPEFIIPTLIDKAKPYALEYAENKLNELINKIPKEMQENIRDPKKLRNYLERHYGLIKLFMPSEMFDKLVKYSEFLATIVSHSFGILFMVLNQFEICIIPGN